MSALTPARDIDAARRRAERIRIKARSITEQYSDLRALVDEAERCEDHLTLGYPSWTAYIADLFGDEPLRLPRDARIPMSNMLAEKGMSTRAIGSVLGVHHDTVADDIKAGVGNPTPAPEPGRIDFATGEVLTDQRGGIEPPSSSHDVEEQESGEGSPPAPRPAQVIGLDGKTYTRPAPKERRRSIVDSAQFAAADLLRAVERIERIYEDDRYPRNREQVAEVTRGYLSRSAELINRLITA